MNQNRVITIDGPSASGKTTVSRELSKQLKCKWVSTGAFYRGLAYVAEAERMDLTDDNGLSALASSDVWSVRPELSATEVYYKDKNVTQDLSKEKVGMIASQISQFPKVREALLAAQRSCSTADEILIAEGRDCGTVVFPQAILKVYLTANSERRAQRRSIDEGTDVKNQMNLQKQRDLSDTERKTAPLQVPEGGVVVDSSSMDLAGVVAQISEMAEKIIKTT